jgi:hypothetical protein
MKEATSVIHQFLTLLDAVLNTKVTNFFIIVLKRLKSVLEMWRNVGLAVLDSLSKSFIA